MGFGRRNQPACLRTEMLNVQMNNTPSNDIKPTAPKILMKFKRGKTLLDTGEGLRSCKLHSWPYVTRKDFANFSVRYIELEGKHPWMKTTINDRVYYVLSGKGSFTVGNEFTRVKPTDVILVPKETPYKFSGSLKLLLVQTPAFDPKYEYMLDSKTKEWKLVPYQDRM